MLRPAKIGRNTIRCKLDGICPKFESNEISGRLLGLLRFSAPAGYQQVAAIEQWLRGQVRYVRGSSDAKTSAVDTAHSKTGVCRDYAHLGISLTRSLNIPARMVVGYLYQLEPMDLHAWFEAFIGGRWFTFDGTQKSPRGNRVTTGYGRDAADVALTSNYGALELKAMKVTVEIAERRSIEARAFWPAESFQQQSRPKKDSQDQDSGRAAIVLCLVPLLSLRSLFPRRASSSPDRRTSCVLPFLRFLRARCNPSLVP